MGDPKKARKKYQTPGHPWRKERVVGEKELKREYGLPRNKEIWKNASALGAFKKQAKRLVTLATEQAGKEKEQMFTKLIKLGILKTTLNEAQIDDVLSLSVRDVLERRLQTIVLKKGLARSMKQARQLITHEHIKIGDKKIKSPSYFVSIEEEANVRFAENSPLADENHPERIQPQTLAKEEENGDQEKN